MFPCMMMGCQIKIHTKIYYGIPILTANAHEVYYCTIKQTDILTCTYFILLTGKIRGLTMFYFYSSLSSFEQDAQ